MILKKLKNIDVIKNYAKDNNIQFNKDNLSNTYYLVDVKNGSKIILDLKNNDIYFKSLYNNEILYNTSNICYLTCNKYIMNICKELYDIYIFIIKCPKCKSYLGFYDILSEEVIFDNTEYNKNFYLNKDMLCSKIICNKCNKTYIQTLLTDVNNFKAIKKMEESFEDVIG